MRNVLTAVLALIVVNLFSVRLAQAADTSFAKIELGRHLVDAGDCVACHTDAKGRKFAGGRAIQTPFGVI
jgi:mono/diheme cytochrome c family protein